MPNFNFFYFLFILACFLGFVALIMVIVWHILQKKRIKENKRASMSAKSYDYPLPVQDQAFDQAVLSRDIFRGCLRVEDINKLPQSVLLNIGDYCDIAVDKDLKVGENRQIIIKALGL